jgi:hypothetical protein
MIGGIASVPQTCGSYFFVYRWRDQEMNFYHQLPNGFLLGFYEEMMKNIEKGLLSKNMYYELGLIISVASQRGITLGKPCDYEQVIDQKELDYYIKFCG